MCCLFVCLYDNYFTIFHNAQFFQIRYKDIFGFEWLSTGVLSVTIDCPSFCSSLLPSVPFEQLHLCPQTYSSLHCQRKQPNDVRGYGLQQCANRTT